MPRLAIVGLAAAAALIATGSPAWGRGEGTAEVFVGSKWLRTSDWSPVERQDEVGILVAFAQERSPVRFAIELLSARDTATVIDPALGRVRVTGSTGEYVLGIRKEWGYGLFRPRLGAGGGLFQARIESESSGAVITRDRTGIGFWVAGGFAFRIARHLDLGLDVRYSKSTVDIGRGLEQIQVEAGGFHAGLVAGVGW